MTTDVSAPTSAAPTPGLLGARFVAGAFLVSGVVHLVRPRVFDRLLPRGMPRRREVIVASGVAELVCAAGLLTRRRWAPRASAALLLLVWPGNWYVAVQTQRNPRASAALRTATWVRVPLQVPMIRWVLRSGHDPRAHGTRAV